MRVNFNVLRFSTLNATRSDFLGGVQQPAPIVGEGDPLRSSQVEPFVAK